MLQKVIKGGPGTPWGPRSKKEVKKGGPQFRHVYFVDPKMEPKVIKKGVKKQHGKKRAPGSLSDHFWEHFGHLFTSKSGPGATSDRFFCEKRDSEQTLVITIYLKDFTGPERTKKQFWAGFLGPKTERKTERRKRRPKTAFGSDFGSFWAGQNGQKRLNKRL